MTTEIHTLIIWSEATDKKEELEIQINSKFRILKEFECDWNEHFFKENLNVFYSHSQKEQDEKTYNDILQNKIKHCGSGTFYLYVLEDLSPVYDVRKTSNGDKRINVNIFDLKKNLRIITGGGHKIHASDTSWESNKDLTILFGKNTEDFLKAEDFTFKKGTLAHNCVGVEGFKSISQLFYLLNNSIDYIVLRNFECLPDSYTLEGHGDIDLLVENLNYIKYLTRAKPVFPSLKYRVHYNIKINEEEIPFDFRYLGDKYLDIKWQYNLLNKKNLFNSIIQIPDVENYFYSLLYHAYVQKLEIKSDYYPKLEKLAQQNGISYDRNMGRKEVKELLDAFLRSKNYNYEVPVDPTVIYNYEFINSTFQKSPYGQKISFTLSRDQSNAYFSEVYLSENKTTIYKVLSTVPAKNEIRFLTKLAKYSFVPKVYNVTTESENSIIEMEYFDGISLSNLHRDVNFWHIENIKKLIQDALQIMKILIQEKVKHRDIKPDNFMLIKNEGHYNLKIIDFGWAINYDDVDPITPMRLGSKYRFKENEFHDIYSLGKTLEDIFSDFPTVKKFVNDHLLKITSEDKDLLLKMLATISSPKNLVITEKEKLMLILKRHPKILHLVKKTYYKIRYNYIIVD